MRIAPVKKLSSPHARTYALCCTTAGDSTGHNGAGKTTAISILTGMIPATSGDAFVGSKSIGSDMGAIRNNLGVCPQFDILWPDLTVDEHLQLYAAIKGYRDADAPGVAAEAAHDVGASPLSLGTWLLLQESGCLPLPLEHMTAT